MNRPKYQIGDLVEVDFGYATMPLKIYGIFDDTNRSGWEYGFSLGINYMWSKLWLSEEYLDKHAKVICSNQSTKLET